ncbi:predicted protein [Sclerotinia sclerotiorum 1980 UF-70]|uniref:Uncharacterized protein n=1 Tax=Sclerotinia sclerotiorum (strain ATCC 18683 / 1980 / Ss-1) TaxID=665079 RepID=A7EXU1_SCLS1|nr:predicted protein [Sclerotinia sclerotiorum 1980 UF-70]EDN94283.1 predicted protein [Sclerotinia sclerotiorum 1980 UF-70]
MPLITWCSRVEGYGVWLLGGGRCEYLVLDGWDWGWGVLRDDDENGIEGWGEFEGGGRR